MYRPSRTDWFRYLIQRSASSVQSIVTNAKPREIRVRGSTTRRQLTTYERDTIDIMIQLTASLCQGNKERQTSEN